MALRCVICNKSLGEEKHEYYFASGKEYACSYNCLDECELRDYLSITTDCFQCKRCKNIVDTDEGYCSECGISYYECGRCFGIFMGKAQFSMGGREYCPKCWEREFPKLE